MDNKQYKEYVMAYGESYAPEGEIINEDIQEWEREYWEEFGEWQDDSLRRLEDDFCKDPDAYLLT